MKHLIASFILLLAVSAQAVPPLPDTPAPVEQVVYARSFELAEGFRHDWRRERPLVDRGVLLVLAVEPALVYPRQTAEPVLYVGDQTAMRLNVGYRSGHIVVLVPGARSPDDAAMIWFGKPRLPERVDKETIATERTLAANHGIAQRSAEEMRAAFGRGEQTLRAASVNEVFAAAAGLVEQYSPDEQDRASALAAQGR
jgi:hypothetical protein